MNNRISHKLIATHPNIWKVLDMLVSEEFHTYHHINQVKTGRKRPSRATKEQIRYKKQLNNLYDMYNGQVIDLREMLRAPPGQKSIFFPEHSILMKFLLDMCLTFDSFQ